MLMILKDFGKPLHIRAGNVGGEQDHQPGISCIDEVFLQLTISPPQATQQGLYPVLLETALA